MMNIAHLILPALLLILLPLTASKGQEPFHFSQTFGSLQFVERTDYDEKELGYSLRYQNERLLKADIYIYDNGIPDLQEGIGSKAVEEEMQSVMNVLHLMQDQGKYKDLQELQRAEKAVPPSGKKFLWMRYGYRQIGGEEIVFTGRRISDTYLLVHRGKFVKIRITTKESDLNEHEKEIDQFVSGVAACLE